MRKSFAYSRKNIKKHSNRKGNHEKKSVTDKDSTLLPEAQGLNILGKKAKQGPKFKKKLVTIQYISYRFHFDGGASDQDQQLRWNGGGEPDRGTQVFNGLKCHKF
jgi:hypothetical protein